MLAQTAFPGIEQYARSDFNEIAEAFNEKWGFDARLEDIEIEYDVFDDKAIYKITGTFQIEDLEVQLQYNCIDDPNDTDLLFDEIDKQDLHDAYQHRFYESRNQPYDAEPYETNPHVVNSATAIMAADDDDPFSDMGFDQPEDEDLAPQEDVDDVSDTLDDMADTLDDLNDALSGIEEDDVDIETENNISDHLIAECEKCHGVFITSIIQSDQAIEKVSGTCPLCDEECDQYIKWVIRDVKVER